MNRLSLSLLVLSAGSFGCVVPPIVTDGDDETDVVADSGGDTGEPPKTVDTQDTSTGFQDTNAFRDTSTLDLDPLDCHPFDPVSYENWQRTYRITFGGGGIGNETHTPEGVEALQNDIAVGTDASGFVVKQQVRNAGSNNNTFRQFSVCGGPGSAEAFDIGYTQAAGGTTLRAGAFDRHKYLPNESQMYQSSIDPAWVVDMSYRVKIPLNSPIPLCPPAIQVRRDVDAQYVGMGFEQLPIAGLGNVDAYHVTVLLDQTQTSGTTNPFCDIFSEAFGELFSIIGGYDAETGGFVTAQIDRWYVRGVGLVKETSIDYNTQATLYSKELTGCSGLPECP